MARIFVIFFSFCFAGICVYGGFYGYTIQNSVQEITAKNPISCEQLLDQIPADLSELQVVDYQCGKHFVPHDFDDDGNWDEVVVPLFPAGQKKLDKNYGAVLIRFADVANKEQLMGVVQSQSISARYEYDEQEIDGHSHNELAKRYPSMDFNKNVVLTSGFPTGSEMGLTLLLASGFGVFICFLFGTWQTVGLITNGSPRKIEPDDDEVYEGVELVSTNLPFGNEEAGLNPLSK